MTLSISVSLIEFTSHDYCRKQNFGQVKKRKSGCLCMLHSIRHGYTHMQTHVFLIARHTNTHWPEMQKYNWWQTSKQFILLIFRRVSSSFCVLHTNMQTHTQTRSLCTRRKSGYPLNRNVTPPGFVAGFRTSPLSDYSCFHSSLSTSFKGPLLPFYIPPFSCNITSFSSSQHFTLSPSSQSSSLSRLCSLKKSLLDATWAELSSPVPRFCLPLLLSFYRSEGHSQSPSLSLSLFLYLRVSPFPLHPDCPKQALYLFHTPKHKYNVLIYTSTHLGKVLIQIYIISTA